VEGKNLHDLDLLMTILAKIVAFSIEMTIVFKNMALVGKCKKERIFYFQ
jgi:hypothetical protein